MTPCIEWTKANSQGYGIIRRGGRNHRVPRYVWENAHGPIPEGMFVCHRCDNPACYNLEHLFLGTAQDNMRDMAAKGRQWHQRRTHCVNGHELGGDNILPSAKPGTRRCRECANRRSRECLRRKYWERKVSSA
jgi:HNH endonuclease